MANINVPWVVEGIITPEQSVTAMIDVIQSKGIQHSGTFWTWENKVPTSHRGLLVGSDTGPAIPVVVQMPNSRKTLSHEGPRSTGATLLYRTGPLHVTYLVDPVQSNTRANP